MIYKLKTNIKKQRGVVLVLTAMILIPAIIALFAFIFDFGRLMIGRRQTQNLADQVALIGANQLWKNAPNSSNPADWATIEGYKDVKPVIKELLLKQHIKGAVSFVPSDGFTDGNPTVDDLGSFSHDTISTASGSGQVTVVVKRKFACYDNFTHGGTLAILVLNDLDSHSRTYCLSNMVDVTVSVSSTLSIFSVVFGVGSLASYSKHAEAHLRPSGNASAQCGQPDCTTICGGNGTQSDCIAYFASNPTPCAAQP